MFGKNEGSTLPSKRMFPKQPCLTCIDSHFLPMLSNSPTPNRSIGRYRSHFLLVYTPLKRYLPQHPRRCLQSSYIDGWKPPQTPLTSIVSFFGDDDLANTPLFGDCGYDVRNMQGRISHAPKVKGYSSHEHKCYLYVHSLPMPLLLFIANTTSWFTLVLGSSLNYLVSQV